MPLQRHLLRSRTVPQTSIAVPTTESLLRAPFFNAFRCDTVKSSKVEHSFGCDASSTVIIPGESHVSPEERSRQCPLAGKGSWNIDAHGVGHAPTGSFAQLLSEVLKNVTSWKTGIINRKMDSREEAEWISPSIKDTTPVKSIPLSTSASFESPCEKFFPALERVFVKSPQQLM